MTNEGFRFPTREEMTENIKQLTLSHLDFQAKLLITMKSNPGDWHTFIDDVVTGKYDPPQPSLIGRHLQTMPEQFRGVIERLVG